jgi:hypothetical protein
VVNRLRTFAPWTILKYNAALSSSNCRKQRVATFGGFLVGREAARRLAPSGQGTIIFTGATASLRGKPPFTAFASAKAGLRSLAGADGLLNIDAIAAAYWHLHGQHRSAWTHELDLRPFKERF